VGRTNPFWNTQTSRKRWRGIFRAPVRKAFFSSQNWEFHMSSKGTIKRIVSDKGFGFVSDDSGQEYFFHQSACQSFDTLREGQAVTFQTGQGPKGPRAENVREA
jgi:CspA family cold shock protein